MNKENYVPNHLDLTDFEPAQVRETSATGFSKDIEPPDFSNSSRTPKECVTNGVATTVVDYDSMSFDNIAAQSHDSLGPNTLVVSQYSQSQMFTQRSLKDVLDTLPKNSQFEIHSEIEDNDDDD